MKNYVKYLAVATALATLAVGVALSGAADANNDITVDANVISTITQNIDASSWGQISVTPNDTDIATSTFDVEVTTNDERGYRMFLKDTSDTYGLVHHSDSNYTINDWTGAFDNPTNMNQTNINAAGVRLDAGTLDTVADYDANEYAGVSSTNEGFGNVTTAVADDTNTIKYGIKVPANQISGEYTGTLTVTSITSDQFPE